ncbi:MAG: multidrug efflux system membrane fusion protein [Psychrosphaera sp.]|jgi:multidrug efflux system membrane fusion protein
MSVFSGIKKTVEQKPYILAILVCILLTAWMLSGNSNAEEQMARKNATSPEVEDTIPSVEVTTFTPSAVSRSIELYGRTEPKRTLDLSSELEGSVDKILAMEGDFVKQGQIILELNKDDRIEQLASAKALVIQRRIEYRGARSLSDKGLQGKSNLEQAYAALTEAKALVKSREVLLEKSTIRAPFSGFLNTRKVEVGTYVHKGDALFQIVDLTKLVVKASITEKYIDDLNNDTAVTVELVDGSKVKGKIRYIASVSDKGTNTFPIEVEIENPNQKMKAGVSTEMLIEFKSEQAIKVTPALLSLDALGNLGVKTVIDEHVVFTPIDLIKAENDGVWLGGFEGETDVITLGQGFVRPGDKVLASYKQQ